MKKISKHNLSGIISRLRHLAWRPKIVAPLVIALFAAVFLPLGSAKAWGPQRPTFTMNSPASYVTFNSITDNPDWGDERRFTLIKDLGTSPVNNGDTAKSGGFTETTPAVVGHTYMVKMFIHNNAASNLNLIAKNTKALASVPTASADGNIMIQGQIKADNCGLNNSGEMGSPCLFWDEAYLTGSDGTYMKVSYVADSARYYNNSKNFTAGGFTLSNDIVSRNVGDTGALLGYGTMDGNVQGCFEYAGYATFLVTVNTGTPSFSITKSVRVKGETAWQKSINAKAGEKVEYQIKYNNIGSTAQNGVIVADRLPGGVKYESKSANLYNSSNPSGANQTDDSWLTNGWGIGNYTPNTTPGTSSAVVEFDATLPDEKDLTCGDNLLQNTATIYTPDGNNSSTADVVIKKECEPPKEKPCELNPELAADDPKCKPCATDPRLLADDPRCVISPDDGVNFASAATVPLVAFLILSGAVVIVITWHGKKTT